MGYISSSEDNPSRSSLGCGDQCRCGPCAQLRIRHGALAEWYVRDEPAPPPASPAPPPNNGARNRNVSAIGRFGEPAIVPRCAAADLDIFLLDAILKRLRNRSGDQKLLVLLKKAVDSTVKALPTFVNQGCCEPHLKTFEAEIQRLPWTSSEAVLRKKLVDAVRAAQQRAKKDFKNC
jgi:hypothetical protein